MADYHVYPIFEADQVLTHEQLNALRAYLDQQQRWSRTCLTGVGIVCGFEVRTQTLGSARSITVTGGVGITSTGHLIKADTATYGRKRAYVSPVAYPPFGTAEEPLALWELLPANVEPEPEITPLTATDLQQSAVVLYLECKEVDGDACTGSDCDQKGINVHSHVRTLLVKRSEAAALLGTGDAFAHDYIIHPLRDAFHRLPDLFVGRPVGLWEKGDVIEERDIVGAYRAVLSQGYLDTVMGTLGDAYSGFRPVLVHDFPTNPFAGQTPVLRDHGAIQYDWDRFQDIALAYNEWRACAFEIMMVCCPDANAFPRHLLLGPTTRLVTDREETLRHVFMASPVHDRQDELVRKLRTLFKRLELIVRSFHVPDASVAQTRITPSFDGCKPLGERALPYYYAPNAELFQCWNPDYGPRGQTVLINSYHVNDYSGCDGGGKNFFAAIEAAPTEIGFEEELAPSGGRELVYAGGGIAGRDGRGGAGGMLMDFLSGLGGSGGFSASERTLLKKLLGRHVRFPGWLFPVATAKDTTATDYIQERLDDRERLRLDIGDYPFFRIEGHIRKNVHQVREKLESDIRCYQLPIAVTALKLGAIAPKTGLADCFVDDLRLVYRTERGAWLCRLRDLRGYLGKLRLVKPKGKVVVKEKPTLKGTIKDHNNNIPMRDVEITLEGTDLKVDSKDDGSFELSDVPPGEYVMNVVLPGYEAKHIPITMEPGSELSFDEVEIRSEAYGSSGKSGAMKYMAGPGIRSEMPETAERGFAISRELPAEAPHRIGTVDALYSLLGVNQLKENPWVALEKWHYQTQPTLRPGRQGYLVDKVQQPLRLMLGIDEIADTLPEEFEDFDLKRFAAAWKELIDRARGYVAQVRAFETDDLFTALIKSELLSRLRLLDELTCSMAFDDLVAVMEQRREMQNRLLLLGPFAQQHPGLEHFAGVPRGGTFILVYGDDQQVVADFALPYMLNECCSGCDMRERVIFALPTDRFCSNDGRPYRFTTYPPGGVVSGPGVHREVTTGDYYFTPAGAGTDGELQFRYLVDGEMHVERVVLETLEIALTYTVVNVDMTAETADVVFAAEPDDADSYLWKFGDGNDATDARVRHRYDLSAGATFDVVLVVTRGGCEATERVTLALATCNARFVAKEDIGRRTGTTVTYRFVPVQEADTYAWTFGVGGGTSTDPTPEFTFDLEETARRVTVSLTVTGPSCTDDFSLDIVLPPIRRFVLSLEDDRFCTNDTGTYPFTLEPPGGDLNGPGIKIENGKHVFVPGTAGLIPGPQRFTYRVDSHEEELVVTLVQVKAVMAHSVLDVDATTGRAHVSFDAAGSIGRSIKWDLGDGNGAAGAAVEHVYSLEEGPTFNVVLEVRDGDCVDWANTTLTFDPCTAKFGHSLTRQGSLGVVVFTAVETEAETYHWTFGDGNESRAGFKVKNSYELGSAPRTVEATLEIRKGACRATHTERVMLPAAETLSLRVTPDIICAKGKPALVEVNLDGGRFDPPIVRKTNGTYLLDPTLQGQERGTIDLTYTAGGLEAVHRVRFVTPLARFEITEIKTLAAGDYLVSFKNTSIDANRYRWTFDNGETSLDEAPRIRFRDVAPGSTMGFDLVAAWDDDCADGISGKILFPRARVDTDPDIGRVRETRRTSATALETAAGLPAFRAAFPEPNDPVLQFIQSGLKTLQAAEADARQRKDLVGGRLNAELGEGYAKQMAELLQRTRRYRGTDMVQKRVAGYRVYVAAVTQLLGIAGMQRRPVAPDGPMVKAVGQIAEQIGAFANLGVKVKPDAAFAQVVETALADAADDPKLTEAIKPIGALLR